LLEGGGQLRAEEALPGAMDISPPWPPSRGGHCRITSQSNEETCSTRIKHKFNINFFAYICEILNKMQNCFQRMLHIKTGINFITVSCQHKSKLDLITGYNQRITGCGSQRRQCCCYLTTQYLISFIIQYLKYLMVNNENSKSK